jgi:nitroreductase
MAVKAKKISKAEQLARLKTEFTETERIILSRRSVRLYTEEQVPEFMVKRILEAGRFAPSAGNSQPWKFVVLRDPDMMNGIADTVVKLCKMLRVTMDYRREGFQWLRPFTKFWTRLRYNDLHWVPLGAACLIAEGKLGLWHGAPTVILIFKDVRGVSNPDLDCGIAGQNMVLAAHSMGLGTCWVGFVRPAFEYTGKWRRSLGIEFPYKFANSIAIGWPKGEPDGMVGRQTHAIDWYEYGTKKTIY